jgi:hypothetical protein
MRGARANALGLGVAACCVVAIGFLIPVQGFWCVDCGLRFLELVNIVDRHHFGGFWLDYPLAGIDPHFALRPFGRVQTFVHAGRLYGQYPPWFVYATAPFYAWLGMAGLRVLPLVAALALLGAVAGLARQCGFRNLWMPACVVLFATPILPYAYIFWDIVPALAFGLWGQVLLVRAVRRNSMFWGALSGLALWLAVVMREEYLLWAMACFVPMLMLRDSLLALRGSWRGLAASAVVFAAGTAALLLINHQLVGVPLFFQASTGSGKVWDYSWSLSTRGWVAWHYMAFVYGLPLADAGLFAALGGLALVAWAQSDRARLALWGIGFVATALARLAAWDNSQPLVTQSIVNSFAASAPLAFMGLSLVSLPPSAGRSPESRALRAAVQSAILFLLATLLLSVPNSAVGLNFGPRLLLPIYPGLVLGALAVARQVAAAAQPMWRRSFQLLSAGLIVIGLLDSAVYLDRLRLQYGQIARMEQFLSRVEPGLPIVCEQQWFTTTFPHLFYERPILPAWDAAKIARVHEAVRMLSPDGCLYVASSHAASQVRSPNVTPVPLPRDAQSVDSAFAFSLVRIRF